MTNTLGDALPKQMAYIRDELIPQYQSIGPTGSFAIMCMRGALDRATKAMVEGDLPAMIAAYKELCEFKS